MERGFFISVLKHGALLCKSSVTNVKLKLEEKPSRGLVLGLLFCQFNELKKLLLEWHNAFLRLRNIMERAQQLNSILAGMYRYVSLFRLSHTTGFSSEKTISILRMSGSILPPLHRIITIESNIVA